MCHKKVLFDTHLLLNSRLNPNTSAPKVVPGRYDPVYEEGSQDYPLPYILARMLPKPQHGGIPQIAGRWPLTSSRTESVHKQQGY
jgi:hypothetical protein